jgi:hypothetical protein
VLIDVLAWLPLADLFRLNWANWRLWQASAKHPVHRRLLALGPHWVHVIWLRSDGKKAEADVLDPLSSLILG